MTSSTSSSSKTPHRAVISVYKSQTTTFLNINLMTYITETLKHAVPQITASACYLARIYCHKAFSSVMNLYLED